MHKMIISFLLAASCWMLNTSCKKAIEKTDTEITVPVDIAFQGIVTDGQRGVAGVVVTDGKNFTQTDNQGQYTLPYRQDATHIYISSPSGYEVAFENSVPMFWKAIRNENDRKNIVFTLKKTPGNDNKHYFIAIGDPQVRNNAELAMLKPILAEMKQTVAEKNLNPVHMMVAGDIVFDTYNMHDNSKKHFSELNAPVYYSIGNHDHVKTAVQSPLNDKTADSNYIRHYGPTYYSFNKGDVHYIILDNIRFEGGPNTKYDIHFSAEQIEWVKKDLSYVPKSKAVVVMFHSPSVTRHAGVYGNSNELHLLLRGYKAVHLISGHTHFNTVYADDYLIEHNVNAVCGAWWEGGIGLDGTNLGYKIFEVNGTDFKWEYHDYQNNGEQFSVYIPETSRAPLLPKGEELLVNVWDWDIAWTVTYSEDNGTTFKPMDRYTEKNRVYDVLAYTRIGAKGEGKIPGRSFIGAVTTDHIFSAIPTPGVKKVIIKVTSRFKTYTKEVEW
jgi:hypothetical protein